MTGKHDYPANRFRKKFIVMPDYGCWNWIAGKTQDGYGRFRVGPKSVMMAHRYAWELQRGKVPEGMQVLHKCDNPSCVNPEHLFLGTQNDNIQDMVSKGRQRGVVSEKQHLAKLDWIKAYEIKWLAATGFSNAHLAKEYGVTRSNIKQIKTNKTWVMECHD